MKWTGALSACVLLSWKPWRDCWQNVWFMHGSAPDHLSYTTRNYLETAYTWWWIGRQEPVCWPSESPDLNPFDFFLRGHLKKKGICFSSGYCKGTALQHVQNSFSLGCSLCGSAWPTFWTSTVTLTIGVISCHRNVKLHFIVNSWLISWTELFLLLTLPDRCLPHGVFSYDIENTFVT